MMRSSGCEIVAIPPPSCSLHVSNAQCPQEGDGKSATIECLMQANHVTWMDEFVTTWNWTRTKILLWSSLNFYFWSFVNTHFSAWFARNLSLFRIASYLAKGYKLLKAYGKLTTDVRCFAKWRSEWEQSGYIQSKKKTKNSSILKRLHWSFVKDCHHCGLSNGQQGLKTICEGQRRCCGYVPTRGIVVSTCWGFSTSPLMIGVIGADEVHFLSLQKNRFWSPYTSYTIVALWLLSWSDNVISYPSIGPALRTLWDTASQPTEVCDGLAPGPWI